MKVNISLRYRLRVVLLGYTASLAITEQLNTTRVAPRGKEDSLKAREIRCINQNNVSEKIIFHLKCKGDRPDYRQPFLPVQHSQGVSTALV